MAAKKKNSAQEALRRAREEREKLAGGWGAGLNFFRFDKGTQTFRFFLDPNGLYCAQGFINGGVSEEGKYFQAANLRWIADSSTMREAALAANKINQEDLDKVAEFGDPCDRLKKALEDTGMDYPEISKARHNPLTKQRVLWAAEADNKVGQLETSGAFLKWFESTMELVDDLLYRDILVKGEGEGFGRKYSYVYGPNAEPDREPADALPDLVQAAARKVVNYDAKVRMVFRSYQDQLATTGLSYDDFGIEA
jgi:hypothetical protein